MMPSTEPSAWRITVVLIAGTGLLFLVCVPTNPNTELAPATREAVQLARDTGSSAESAGLWSGRFGLLAIDLGVSAPIVVAFLIWRTLTVTELDAAEILEGLEQHKISKLATLRPPNSVTGQSPSLDQANPDASPQA